MLTTLNEAQDLELLNRQMELVQAVGETSMLWWVSTHVFSATILGAMWAGRGELRKLFKSRMPALALAMYTFYASQILYGALVLVYSFHAEAEVRILQERIGGGAHGFDAEFNLLQCGIFIGTTTFVLVLIAWWQLHTTVLTGRRRTNAKKRKNKKKGRGKVEGISA